MAVQQGYVSQGGFLDTKTSLETISSVLEETSRLPSSYVFIRANNQSVDETFSISKTYVDACLDFDKEKLRVKIPARIAEIPKPTKNYFFKQETPHKSLDTFRELFNQDFLFTKEPSKNPSIPKQVGFHVYTAPFSASPRLRNGSLQKLLFSDNPSIMDEDYDSVSYDHQSFLGVIDLMDTFISRDDKQYGACLRRKKGEAFMLKKSFTNVVSDKPGVSVLTTSPLLYTADSKYSLFSEEAAAVSIYLGVDPAFSIQIASINLFSALLYEASSEVYAEKLLSDLFYHANKSTNVDVLKGSRKALELSIHLYEHRKNSSFN